MNSLISLSSPLRAVSRYFLAFSQTRKHASAFYAPPATRPRAREARAEPDILRERLRIDGYDMTTDAMDDTFQAIRLVCVSPAPPLRHHTVTI